jgi:hypothetical protein
MSEECIDLVEREALDVLRMVVAFMDSRTTSKDAPGHSHLKRGIWDSDNIPELSGKPCEWCALWGRARTLARAQISAPSGKETIV